MASVFQTIRNVNRIRQVINILLKYGFEEFVTTTPLRKLIPARQQSDWFRGERPVFSYTTWERIRMVIEELGPTFVKLAQVASNRPDLLPEPLIKELEKLQSNVPPFSYEEALHIVAEELGRPVADIFAFFDKVPLGSASIGQVHRARLHTGEDVVVKVQRPDIENKIYTDLQLIKELVKLTENYFKNIGILNPNEIVETFEKSLLRELDYQYELRHIEQFRKLYEHVPHLYIPRPYRELSSKRVLTMEFVSGCKITDVKQLKAWGLSPEILAQRGLQLYLMQIFEYGFFHADPHPGNVLVRPNGDIALLDYGMVGKLSRAQRFAFAGVFIGMAQRDARRMALNLQQLAVEHEIEDIKELENDLEELIEDLIILDTGEAGIKVFTERLQRISYKHGLQIPGNIFLILRALAILEGIGLQIYPTFDTLEAVKPYSTKLLAEQFSWQNVKAEFANTFLQVGYLIAQMPDDVRTILGKLRQGKLHFNVQLTGYEELLSEIESLIRRLSLTILIAALLIFSGLSLRVDYGQHIPQLWGISYVTLISWIVAGILSTILLLLTLKRKE